MEEERRKNRGIGRTLIVLAVVLVIVLLLLLPPTQDLLRKVLLDPFSPHYPEEVEMTVTRTYTLDANGGHILSYTIDIPVAKDLVSDGVRLQDITYTDIDPDYDELWDNGTYDTMVWEGVNLHSTYTVSVTCTVTQKIHEWDLDENVVLDVGDIPQALQDTYLDDEWKIIVDDPEITALRQQIVGNETNVYTIVKNIYDWMVDNLNYSTVSVPADPKDSLTTLADREGDCDDQSILFCALARSAGVAAWLQLGGIYDTTTGEMGGHGWVQLYMPTEDGGVNVTLDIVNEDFLVWMPNLFCEYTDTGNGDDLYSFYHTIYASYDPTSYASGQGPLFSKEWSVTGYQESEETVILNIVIATRVES